MLSLAVPALAAAAAASTLVPIAIHLLWRRRRRPIEWGAMALLLEAVRRRRKALQLERWLLLAVRVLLLLLLGLGLAQLSLSGGGIAGGSRTVHLILDDGAASAAIEADGRGALAALAEQAAAIVAGLSAGDAVGVVAASHPPRVLVEPTVDHGRALAAIRAASASPTASDLAGAIEAAEGIARRRGEPAAIVLLSGLRAGSLAAMPQAPRRADDDSIEILRLSLPPRREPLANLSVASIEASRPIAAGMVAPVRVTIRREGELPAEVAALQVSGPRLPTAVSREVRFAAGQRERTFELGVPLPALDAAEEPLLLVEASVGPDAQALDDRRLALLDARSRTRIGLASRAGRLGGDPAAAWLSRALAPDRGGPNELVELDAASLSGRDLRGLDAIVVARPDLPDGEAWGRLREFVDSGGLVVVLPPPRAEVHEWLDRLAAAFDPPWRFSPIAEATDPPLAVEPPRAASPWTSAIAAEAAGLVEAVEVSRRLPPDGAFEERHRLVDLSDGTPLVAAVEPAGAAGGALVLFAAAADLAWTTLPVRPLMVPLLQEILREGLARAARGRVALLGERSPPAILDAVEVQSPSGERIEVSQGRLATPLREAGEHLVLDRAGRARDRFVAGIDPAAASTLPAPQEILASRLGEAWSFADAQEIVRILGEDARGRSLAMPLLWAALLLAVLETVLARRFSHAASRVEASA